MSMIYLAINSGGVQFASREESEVIEYIDIMNSRLAKSSADEYNLDFEEEPQWQSSYDREYYEGYTINEEDLKLNDEVLVEYALEELEVTDEEVEELLSISLEEALKEYNEDDDY